MIKPPGDAGVVLGKNAQGRLCVVLLYVAIVLVALDACEVILRLYDPSALRIELDERNLHYRYDSELGWFPVSNSFVQYTATRTVVVRHNSLGLRDREYGDIAKETFLFLGDSFVWGYDVEANERFTDILQRDLTKARIVNAGVSGYGTDQEYLLMKRLWTRISPSVVVLIFHNGSDHEDNTSNQRYDGYYKPYYVLTPAGGEFKGIPVPKSRRYFFTDTWLARNSLLARLTVLVFLARTDPEIHVPDPTEHLIAMMRRFVEANGARFLVGLEHRGPELEALLRAQGIPYTSFDDAPYYPAHRHWTPEGHALVAARLRALFAGTGLLPSDNAKQ